MAVVPGTNTDCRKLLYAEVLKHRIDVIITNKVNMFLVSIVFVINCCPITSSFPKKCLWSDMYNECLILIRRLVKIL